MKSHILSLLLLCLACLGMVACSEHDWDDVEQSKGIELSVSCANASIARATKPGEPEYNENLIETLHYFLYPQGKTNENAVISGKIGIDDGKQGNVVVQVPLKETELNTILFPLTTNSRTCEVYLIANLPEGLITDGSDTSLDELKELVITTDFNTKIPQSSFIMDGQCTANLISRNQTIAAEGKIELKRLAAKITTRVSVNPSFTDTDGKEYTPLVDSLKIHLDNAGKTAALAGDVDFATELFDYEQRIRIDTKTENVNGVSTTYNVFEPFYSYPRRWDYDDNALVMYVMLPWEYQQDGVTRIQKCYYKVYLGTMQLERNNWYNLNLNIGVLGSFSQEEELVTLTDFEYKVVDWKNGYDDWSAGVDLEAEILSAYYLVVEQNEYVVNNKNTFDFSFITSHECIIQDLQVTKKIFVENGNPVNKDKYVTQDAINGNWITIEGNTIKLNHTLNNDFESTTNKNYDYTPYVFTFTLCHKNNSENFQERITIIQKPAISVTAELNSRYEKSNGSSRDGYVFVNANSIPNYNNTNNSNNFGGVGNLQTSGNNSNPYMYTIEISVLPEGSAYILGDPRIKYNWGSTDLSSLAQAPALEGDTPRKLSNYYGTNTDKSVENMIAPKFRISSAHGWVASSFQNHANTLKRSASYQEDGYPAGRWRVPTMAEIRFVAKLYADTHIPPLFSSGTGYWCASGSVTPSSNGSVSINNNTNSGSYAVRSVYDVWYWEKSAVYRLPEDKYSTFTWGDEIE